MSKLTHGPLPLFAVLLLAAVLRVWGLTWGLPSATHYFSYHPDESRVLQVAMFNMNLFTGHLLPQFYNYGSLQIYLVNIANSLAFVFGAVDIVPKDMAVWYPQWARMYLIGRCLTVGMGIGTVWATYALGRYLWGRRAGLLSALILAITPIHAQHSHWLTVDVPATFWVVLSLLWTAKGAVLAPPAPNHEGAGGAIRAAVLAGLFAGLAAATKYNMVLVLLPLIFVCLTPPGFGAGGRSALPGPETDQAASRLKLLLLGLITAGIAFLLACPGAVLETRQFLSDLRFEAVHVGNANDPTFKDTGNGFVYHITENLSAGLGWPLLALALASVVYALVRRERGDGLLAAFALPYYILISLAAVRYARYVIPLLPILALWAGRLLADLSRLHREARPGLENALVRVAFGLGTLALLLTLGWTLLLLQPMAQTDNRDRALAWLQTHAATPTVIAFPVQPWFGTAPVSPYFPAPHPGAWRRWTSPETAARILYKQDWDIGLLDTARPPVVVVSEYDTRDALRLGDPAASVYMQDLRRNYTVHGLFGSAVRKEQWAFLGHDLPPDMLYTNPEITIYERKH